MPWQMTLVALSTRMDMRLLLLRAVLLGQITFENKRAHRRASSSEWILDANRTVHLIVLKVLGVDHLSSKRFCCGQDRAVPVGDLVPDRNGSRQLHQVGIDADARPTVKLLHPFESDAGRHP